MFRKISFSVLIAVVALLVFAVAVSAQGRRDGPGPNADGNGRGQMYGWQQQNRELTGQPNMHRFNDGTCANFVDEDGDGICDNAGTGAQLGRMSAGGKFSSMNRGQGTGMGSGVDGQRLHRFGDGACDYETPPRDGTGNQYGQ